MDLSDFKFIQLNSDVVLNDFECGEDDITNFLKEDALRYQIERMANTYLFLNDNGAIVAYFSISNDCLVDRGEEKAIRIPYLIDFIENPPYQMKKG